MMKVADLIALLQTMPQDVPVTAYNVHEDTGFVTPTTVKLHDTAKVSGPSGYSGLYVDIMGSL